MSIVKKPHSRVTKVVVRTAAQPSRATYIRFEVPAAGTSEGEINGIFVAAYQILTSTELHDFEVEQISELVVWTKTNLKVPDRFTSSKSKRHYHRNTLGLSWFKDSAHEHLKKIRELSSLLRAAGIDVEERVTKRPGYIVYEDEHQIVAEPFREA